MNLANYINDLLFRYDCVIVPDFGGFITNRISAKLNNGAQIFYPPTKQIAFNSHLKHTDGLLANYIASTEQISFEKASIAISLSVIKWKNELQNTKIQLDNLGTISLNENKQIIFEPTIEVNFLTSSFGFSTISSSPIKRYVSQVKSLTPILKNEDKKGVPVFIKYAATAAILLTVGFMGHNHFKQYEQNQQKKIEKKIQSATFIIANPLPTLELNVIKKVSKPYHVIAGVFQFTQNADRKLKQLIYEGFNAEIVGVNEWGLTQVAFDSYTSRNEAIKSLNKIRETASKEAWLLVRNIK